MGGRVIRFEPCLSRGTVRRRKRSIWRWKN